MTAPVHGLDGTLLRTDTLDEWGVAAILRAVSIVSRLPSWLMPGKANLMHRLAKAARVDGRLWPYKQQLIECLCESEARGRRSVIATAENSSVARAVSDHLRLFYEVFGSDGTLNLKG